MSSSAQVKYCHACGNPLDPRAELCPRCGVRQAVAPAAAYGVGQRSRLAAALLAIFLGISFFVIVAFDRPLIGTTSVDAAPYVLIRDRIIAPDPPHGAAPQLDQAAPAP